MGLSSLGGRAIQIGGLYLFGIILPFIFFRNILIVKNIKSSKNIGLLILGLFLIFPLTNLLAQFLSQDISSLSDIKISHKLTSSVGISGVLMILFGIYYKNHPVNFQTFEKPIESETLLSSFLSGLFWGTIILLGFNAIQFGCHVHIQQATIPSMQELFDVSFSGTSGCHVHQRFRDNSMHF